MTPSSLDLIAWYDVSALTGLSDLDGIESLTDQSGGGRHASQATSGNRPTYRTNQINGLPVARFDGVNDRLVWSSGTNQSKPLTVWAVARRTGVTERQYILDSSFTGTNQYKYRNVLALLRDGALGAYHGGEDVADGPDVWRYGGAADTSWHIYVMTVYGPGRQTSLEVDGRGVALSGASGGSPVRGVTIGSNNAQNADFFAGDLGEIGLVAGALGPSDREDLVAYLAEKWDLPIGDLPVRPTAAWGTYSGSSKWAYGAVDVESGRIYAAPSVANSYLVIDPTDDSSYTVSTASSPYHIGATQGADGLIYSAPGDIAGSVRRIDPDTDTVSTVGSSQARGGYGGIAAGTSIYFPPYWERTSVLKVDTAGPTVTSIGTVSSDQEWGGGVLSAGAIWCPPRTTGTGILKIDPDTDTVSTVGSSLASVDRAWSMGVEAPDGRVYFTPKNEHRVLVLDPGEESIDYITVGSTDPDKWATASVGPDGRVYCWPRQAGAVLVIDPTDDSWEMVPFGTGGFGTGDRFVGAVSVGNTAYSIPFASQQIMKWRWGTEDPLADGQYVWTGSRWAPVVERTVVLS